MKALKRFFKACTASKGAAPICGIEQAAEPVVETGFADRYCFDKVSKGLIRPFKGLIRPFKGLIRPKGLKQRLKRIEGFIEGLKDVWRPMKAFKCFFKAFTKHSRCLHGLHSLSPKLIGNLLSGRKLLHNMLTSTARRIKRAFKPKTRQNENNNTTTNTITNTIT